MLPLATRKEFLRLRVEGLSLAALDVNEAHCNQIAPDRTPSIH